MSDGNDAIHERTRLLLGDQLHKNLSQKNILIAGLGGVGSFAVEAIARVGIEKITLIDHDCVDPSNINRQLIALDSTIGQKKIAIMTSRINDINAQISVTAVDEFITPENTRGLLSAKNYDYVLDCIDSISCKAAMVVTAQQLNVPVISAMGAGGRLDASQLQILSLNQTHTCPLAKAMRRKVKSFGGSPNYPVVFSAEVPVKGSAHKPVTREGIEARPRSVNGTISYLPGMMGLMMAGHVIQALLNQQAD